MQAPKKQLRNIQLYYVPKPFFGCWRKHLVSFLFCILFPVHGYFCTMTDEKSDQRYWIMIYLIKSMIYVLFLYLHSNCEPL